MGYIPVPSGLQVFNDGGQLQIDSDSSSICFIRKGSLTTAAYTNGGVTTTNPTRASVTVAQNELIAFSSTSPTAIVSRTGNAVTFAAASPAGAVVNYWIFGISQAGPSNAGLQVFREDGTLAFDSSWKLMNFVGSTTGNGNTSTPTGRLVGVMPQMMYIHTTFDSVVGGVSPNVFIIDSRVTRMSAASLSAGVVSVSTAIVDQWAFTRPAGSVGPSGVSTNGATPVYLMVDVTGL